MINRAPAGYTTFLEQLLRDLPTLASQRKPGLANQLHGANLLRSRYQVKIPHSMMAELLWSFRQNRITKHRESKTFNVEFTPRASCRLDPAEVQAAWREADLEGELGFNGSECFFQIVWGHGRETDRLVHDANLINELRDWAIDAISVAIEIVERPATHERLLTPPRTETIDSPRSPDKTPGDGNLSEGLLENLIISQWDMVFGEALEFTDRQVSCGSVGILDILARDRRTRDYVVIELKKATADDAVFGQLARYMGWIKENVAGPADVGVRGIIVASQITHKLRSAALSHPNVELLAYDFGVQVRTAGSKNSVSSHDAEGGATAAPPGWRLCACGEYSPPVARYCRRCGGPFPSPRHGSSLVWVALVLLGALVAFMAYLLSQ